MPKKIKFTIEISVDPANNTNREGLWLGEILRYAGISKQLDSLSNGVEIYQLGEGTQEWAKMNADRIRSFGIYAVPVVVLQ